MTTNQNQAPVSQWTIEQCEQAALQADESGNRQRSIAYTRAAEAKRFVAQGDAKRAKLYWDSAKRAFLRAQEDEMGQLARVAEVEQVVAERGAKLDAMKPGGKDVVKMRAEQKGATWRDTWAKW